MAGFVTALFAAAVMAQAQPAADAASAQEPAPAPESAAPAAPAAPAKTEKAKPEKICVEEVATGSLFRRKVCATREEWAKRRARDQETMTEDGATQR
jgi:hypothetical protein